MRGLMQNSALGAAMVALALAAVACDVEDETACDGGMCEDAGEGTGGDEAPTGGSGGDEGPFAGSGGDEGPTGGVGGSDLPTGGTGGEPMGGAGGGDPVSIDDRCEAVCLTAGACAITSDNCPDVDDPAGEMAIAQACTVACIATDLSIDDLEGEVDCDATVAIFVADQGLADICNEPAVAVGVACGSEEAGNGVCLDTGDCMGAPVEGLCGGGVNNQCCIGHPCELEDGSATGTCMHTDACGGTSTPGLCPGSAGIQCCTE